MSNKKITTLSIPIVTFVEVPLPKNMQTSDEKEAYFNAIEIISEQGSEKFLTSDEYFYQKVKGYTYVKDDEEEDLFTYECLD